MSTKQPAIKYFIYARKSTESEDRQVASIDSQIQELQTIAERDRLEVVKILSESRSAKAPGRPVFTRMLQCITRGEATGILCWKLDRLARNPVDGGNVSWLLQQGGLQHIRTYERSYYPTDNVLMMSVELGMANQYIRDLSVNVKRGLRAKAQTGWYPGISKPGYRNAVDERTGEHILIPDPDGFPLLRRAFHLVLDGMSSVPQVLQTLNQDWGYRTPQRKKSGGGPLLRSVFYRILTDPFYYGRFEFPNDSGLWYEGKHQPMLTEAEFWRIQARLGVHGRTRPQKLSFAYTGLLHCGECGAAITAEMKEHIVCAACAYKFSARHQTRCPRCQTEAEVMEAPKCRRYIYYHCTKKKTPVCSQRAVERKQLERQISRLLGDLTISDALMEWTMVQLEKQTARDADHLVSAKAALQAAYENERRRLDNLLKLKISPQNSEGDLLNDEEFGEQKRAIAQEMEGLKRRIVEAGTQPDRWLETCKRVFQFGCDARKHFEHGAPETKRAIVGSLGSNLALYDRNLRISLHPHFLTLQRFRDGVERETGRVEPSDSGLGKGKNRAICAGSSRWLTLLDDVRTFFMKEAEHAHIPELKNLGFAA